MSWIDFDPKKHAMITPDIKIVVESNCTECGEKIPVDHISMPGKPDADVLVWVPPCPSCSPKSHTRYKLRKENED